MDAIIAQAKDEDIDEFIWTLGTIRHPNPKVDAALVEMLLEKGADDEHERLPQCLRMRRMGNPGMVVLLLEAMQKGDENARDIIAEYLRWERPAGNPALVSILIDRLKQGKDREPRVAAAKALSGAGQGSQVAIDALFEVLNQDVVKELREAIILSLIRLGGPRDDIAEEFYKAIKRGIYYLRTDKLSALLNKLAEPSPDALQCADLLA